MTDQDPLQEPENSTVDDWHGQEVGRMEDRADQAVDDAGGDMEEAERRFEEGEDTLPPTAAAAEGDEAPSG